MTSPADSCYRLGCEKVRTSDSRHNVESRQDNFPRLVELKTIGQRLVFAFRERYGTEGKQFIAEKLGYKTAKAVYKVISGERQLGFDHLKKFKESTYRSIDWLLIGEDEAPSKPLIDPKAFKENYRAFIELLALDSGKSFDDVVRELVVAGLDERARDLSGSYQHMSPKQVEEVVNAYLANTPKESGREAKKRR
jgi:hypothetical protein